MLPKFKTAAIATLTALSIALTAAAPAQALGKNERNFLKGVAAAALVGALIHENRSNNTPEPQYRPAPPRQDWNNGRGNGRGNDRHYDRQSGQYYDQRNPGRVIGQAAPRSAVYNTVAAQSFNNYTLSQRRQIQRALQGYGYYRGGIDGTFGPGTYSAVQAYARDSGGLRQLDSRAGAFGVYDSLVY